VVKGFDIHIGKDVTPAAQSGSRRIAEFVCWGETDGVGLVSIRLVLLFKGDRLRGAKRLLNQRFRDYGGHYSDEGSAMLALIYLGLAVYLGDRLCRRFYRFASCPHRWEGAVLVGLIIGSWFTYLAALVSASTSRVITRTLCKI
jgi:hypothetical protein